MRPVTNPPRSFVSDCIAVSICESFPIPRRKFIILLTGPSLKPLNFGYACVSICVSCSGDCPADCRAAATVSESGNF